MLYLNLMKIYIALDIGGTKMRAASYLGDSFVPIKKNSILTYSKGIKPKDLLLQIVRSVWPEDSIVEALGIAVAGPINIVEGKIEKSPNLPEFNDFSIGQFLKEAFHIPVFLGNDANLACLGEWKFGAGQGHQNIIYLTISTGIGSGVISDGVLLIGSCGMGAELGHVTIIPGGCDCSCGKKGHLEAYSSGTAIARWFKSQLKNGGISTLNYQPNISSREIAHAAYEGDNLSIEAFKRAGRILGLAITNFLHIFNPTCIIFGGGVSNSIDLILPEIKSVVEDEVIDSGYYENLIFETSALKDDIGILGALALARGI